jgi:hypothetical protein
LSIRGLKARLPRRLENRNGPNSSIAGGVMSRIKILSRKIFNHKLLRVVAGWLAFLCGQTIVTDHLFAKIALLSVARVLP